MFRNNRYLTRGVHAEIPLELQIFMWECVDRMPAPKDSFQIFDLVPVSCMQGITHRSEQPEYRMEYIILSDSPIAEKLYVIDDGDHTTMLLSTEY